MKFKGDPKLQVKILSPSQTYYEGPAHSVSAVNKVGPFDVLANHANFFSLLSKGDIVVSTPGQELRFPIEDGIVKVTNNAVTLFVYLPSSNPQQ
ncbi:MAG: F0F1 ATP synthase subunit epsilon [Candidatus Saccharimonadales bacterium]